MYLCTFPVAFGKTFIIDQKSYMRRASCSLLLMISCGVNKGWRMRSEGPIRPQQWLLSRQIAALQDALLHTCSRLLLSGLSGGN